MSRTEAPRALRRGAPWGLAKSRLGDEATGAIALLDRCPSRAPRAFTQSDPWQRAPMLFRFRASYSGLTARATDREIIVIIASIMNCH